MKRCEENLECECFDNCLTADLGWVPNILVHSYLGYNACKDCGIFYSTNKCYACHAIVNYKIVGEYQYYKRENYDIYIFFDKYDYNILKMFDINGRKTMILTESDPKFLIYSDKKVVHVQRKKLISKKEARERALL